MDPSSTTTSTPIPAAAPARGAAWILALRAQLTAPLTPRSTMTRCADISLPVAYASHWLMLALGSAGFFFLATAMVFAAESMLQGNEYFARRYPTYSVLVMEGLTEAWRSLYYSETWIGLCFLLLGVELGFAGLTVLLLAWGAVYESLRDSWRHAFRTVWLQTGLPFGWLTVFLVGPVGLSVIEYQYRMSRVPWAQRLFLVRHSELVVGMALVLASVWALAVLLRAVTTRARRPAAAPTTMCETCGYQLSHTPVESRCPECGEPAADSIGPGRRRPNRWEQPDRPRARAYLRTCADVLFHPKMFFRTMQVTRGQSAARRFGLLTIVLTSALTLAGACVLFAAATHRAPAEDDLVEVLIWIPFITFGCIFGILCLGASCGGVLLSRVHRRNLLPMAAKVCLYSSCLYLLWIPGMLFLAAALLRVSRAMPHGLLPMLWRYNFGRPEQVALIVTGLNLAVVPLVFEFHRRALRQVTYANT